MKEVSIEQKAKAYDEVREKIVLRFGSNVAEEIFSEFEMSEDERVRKAIIELVRQSSEVLDKQNQSNMLAWLEKQGDSFIKWNKNTKDNKPPFNHSVLMLTKSGISEGEWRGGNQWLQYRWSGIVRDSDVTGWMELSVLEKQGEQNHIEQNLEIVEALRTEYEKGRADAIAEMRVAWSEEDECYMRECISAIATKDGWSFEEKRKTKHWLNFLKERYTWRPSDAQMNAFKQVYDWYNTHFAQSLSLNSLYYDLKKLKGE